MRPGPAPKLPLDSLLLRLQQQGFVLAPDQLARVQQLLLLLGIEGIAEPQRLRTLLAPIIAQDASEQRRFYEIFDTWLQDYIQPPPETASEEGPSPPVLVAQRRRWLWPLMGALALGILLLTGYWLRPEPALPDMAATFTLSSQCLRLGDTLFAEASPIDASYTYSWDLGDQRQIDSLFRVKQVFQDLGTYTIALTVSDGTRESQSQQLVHVYAGTRPSARIQVDTLEAGKSYRFSSQQQDSTWQYHWDFGTGDTANGPSAAYTFSNPEAYTVRLRIRLPDDRQRLCQAQASFLMDLKEELVSLPKLEPLRINTEDQPWHWRISTWLGVFGLWVLITAFLLFGHRYRQRPPDDPGFARALTPGEGPPVELPFPSQDAVLEADGEIRLLAEALRQREHSERHELDVVGTVDATIKGGGYPLLQYTAQERSVEYLALVETQGEQDQQARLFGRLLSLLKDEDVPIDIWYYHGTPERCFRRDEDDSVPLNRLMGLYHRHRLLIFGAGHQFLTRAGALRPSLTDIPRAWAERALLTPLSVADWGQREQRLREHFVLLPADILGQVELLAVWQADAETDFRALQRRLLRERPAADALLDYDLDSVTDLRAYLGEARFRWLAAAALYPRPVWELTLAMTRFNSQASSPLTGAGGENEPQPPFFDDLLDLTRLPWLRDGDLSETLRADLIASLSPAEEAAARRTLLALLQQIKVPKNSHAAREQEIQTAVQKAILAPEDSQEQAGLRLLLKEGLLDPALRARVKAQLPAEEKRKLPEWQRGIVGAGLIISFLLLFFIDPVSKSGGLARQEVDSLVYYTNAAAHKIDEGQFEAASTLVQKGISIIQANPVTPEGTINLFRPLTYQKAYIRYLQGRQQYAAEAFDSALVPWQEALGALKTASIINPGQASGIVSGWVVFADTTQEHLQHAIGLAQYYNGDLPAARQAQQALPSGFYGRFGVPNLLTLLGGAELDAQIQALLAIANGKYELLLLDGDAETDVAALIGQWEALRAAYEEVLALAPGNPTATQRLKEINAEISRLAGLSGSGQPYRLQGQVLNAQTGQPLDGISLSWEQGTGQTDATGQFDLILANQDLVTLTLRYPGFSTLDTSLTLPLGVPLILRMQPQAFAAFSIIGQVQDAETDSAVGGTRFWLNDQAALNQGTDNAFILEHTPQNDVDTQVRLRVEAPGYQPTEETVELPVSGMVIISLAPDTSSGDEGVDTDTTPVVEAIFPNLISIPGGTFIMGDVMGDNEFESETPHEVTLSPFQLAATGVSFAEYDAYCQATGRTPPADEGWGRADRPVINVEWYDAVRYCNWLSAQAGYTPVYRIDSSQTDPNNTSPLDDKKWLVSVNGSANGYRLPTEAEWEYAARQAGDTVRFGNGRDTADAREINFDASRERSYSRTGTYRRQTVSVGSLRPNALGLYHMSGNVWEWCWDWYDDYPGGPVNNPKGGNNGTYRVLRGGSWGYDAGLCRVALRYFDHPVLRDDVFGFRLARSP